MRPDGVMAICRPGSDGKHRTTWVRFEGRDHVLENARWRDGDGLIHQASEHHNQTLCEMGRTEFATLLHLGAMTHTVERVTCVACMGYVTWHDYPVD